MDERDMKQSIKLKLQGETIIESHTILATESIGQPLPSNSRMRQRIRRIKLLLQGALDAYPPSPAKAFKRLQTIFDQLEFLEQAVDDGHDKPLTFQSTLSPKHLHYLAFHDSLTKIPNRRYFKAAVEQLINEGQHKKTFHLAFIDLDNFKTVNDVYGHEMGDWILIQVSRRLQHCLRKSDIICRYGGDEFILALQHCPLQEDLIIILQRIIAALTRPFRREAVEIKIGASIGVVTYKPGMRNFDDLIHKADVAMYQAKMTGKNQYCLWEQAMAS
jgi:diguanylate cyclase (GGDEF)-like protein